MNNAQTAYYQKVTDSEPDSDIVANPLLPFNIKYHPKTHGALFGRPDQLFYFRAFVSLFSFGDLVMLVIVQYNDLPHNFEYQTQWGLFTTWLYFFWVTFWNMGKNNTYQAIPHKIPEFLRVLNFTLVTLELLVSLAYWSVLFPFGIFHLWDTMTWHFKWSQIAWHSYPTISIFIETVWNMHTFKWSDILYPSIYGAVYIIWYGIMVRCLNIEPPYPIQDFKDWWTALYILVCTVFGVGFASLVVCVKDCHFTRMGGRVGEVMGRSHANILVDHDKADYGDDKI